MLYPHFRLTTTPCQYTRSKTNKTIEYIKKHLLNSYEFKRKKGIHKITLVFTNKSLPETEQWKYRLGNQLDSLDLKILLLNSKKDSDYTKMFKIRDYILDELEKAEQLPDIIVMCTHKSRIKESVTFIKSVSPNGRINLSNIGINRIIFDIMFDEADKGENISYISNFLELIKYLETDDSDNYSIESINFITATPLKNFWKKLLNHGIDSLENIDKYIENTSEDNCFETNYENYRKLDDHRKEFTEDMENNPVIYAGCILNKIKKTPKPRIVYAPGSTKKITHKQIKEIFLREGYDILTINGTNKEFIIEYEIVSIKDFNKKYQINGELKDTLMKYRKIHPNRNLVITGNICIERGVTFNTDGFQFTDSIISNTHSKNIASLIQFLGRSNGHTKYCDPHTLHIPKSIYDKAIEAIEILINIQKEEPKIFKERDFRNKTKREIDEVAYTIPILIILSKYEYDEIITKKKGNHYPEQFIKNLVSKKLGDRNIFEYEKDQISEPRTTNSYKKHIHALIKAIESKQKFSIDIKKQNRENNRDVYQVWLDKENKNLILSYYNGSLKSK